VFVFGSVYVQSTPEKYLKLASDMVLSLHASETPETRHFLNAKSIGLLPPGAVVVNTARGGLVVDEDLIAALRSGQVAAGTGRIRGRTANPSRLS